MGGVVLGTGLGCPAHAIPHTAPLAMPALKLTRSLGHVAHKLPEPIHSGQTRLRASAPDQVAATVDPFRLKWAEARHFAQAGTDDVADAPTASPEVTVEVTESAPSPAGVPPPGAPPPEESRQEKQYGLAPIRWGGQFGYTRRYSRPEDGATSVADAFEVSLRAASYILQPWIARINGNASLVLFKASTSGEESSGSDALALSGSLVGNVFPLSRFPLTLSLSVSDSRTETSLDTNTRRTYRFAARQDYRPIRGSWSAFGTYDWDHLEGDNVGNDTIHRIGGGYRWKGDSQSANVQGSLSRNERTDGFASQTLTVNGNHNLRLRSDLQVNSTGTLLQDRRGRGTGSDSELQTMQVFSSANWTPIESPWSATAAARASRSKSGGGPSSSTLGMSAAARYQFNRNLTGNLSLGVTTSHAAGATRTSSTQGGGLSYSADALKLGKYSYNWGSNLSFSNTVSDESDSRSVSTGAYHSINRLWQPATNATLSGSANQAYAYTRSFGLGRISHTHSLTHAASLALQGSTSRSNSGSLGVTVSDTRTRGDQTAHFQLLNVQFNGRWILSRRSQFHGNLSFQKVWREQRSDPLEEDVFDPVDPNDPVDLGTDRRGQNQSLNGTLSYFHDRPFSVRGLRYTARYTASDSSGREREFGIPGAEREQTSQDLEQNLDYRIGRLTARLQFRVAEIDGRKNALLFFRVTRSFGAY